MKIPIVVAALVVLLSFMGCSKQAASSSATPVQPPRLVPATVAELEASPDFKVDYTTKRGTKIYIRYLDPKVDKAIATNSPDFVFRDGYESKPYLIAVAYRGSVESTDSVDALMRNPDGSYTSDGEEIFVYCFKRASREMATEYEKMKRYAPAGLDAR
jgi:hypothetical protein